MNYVKERKKIVEWTKRELIGSNLVNDILSGTNPLDRIFTGFLFPIGSEVEEVEEDNILDSGEIRKGKPVKKKKRYLPPSSAGFSFYITGSSIKFRIFFNAVQYISEGDRGESNQSFTTRMWEKTRLGSDDGEKVIFTLNSETQYFIFNNKARIDTLWRKYKDGYIITITMSNEQKLYPSNNNRQYQLEKNEKTLFEVELKCFIENGIIGKYPTKDKNLMSEEEKEIELRYQDINIYAVGHGVAVDWSEDSKEIWLDFMPAVEVPQITANTTKIKTQALRFSFLEKCTDDPKVIKNLEEFVANYENWIINQNESAKLEDIDNQKTVNKILSRLQVAQKRMREGIQLLEKDNNALIAFSLTNKAMLMQMISSDKHNGIIKQNDDYEWRPFQLAFILMVLESSVNDDSFYRETLDLIWFPTGGGKTEAYLGLMSFLFIYRRLKYPSSSFGTTAIMRYTLRLLTAQQFQRACKVIFALELIRQKDENELGIEPFSVGLWIGGESTPNTIQNAEKNIKKNSFSKLILNSCPWCGEEFTSNNYVSTKDDFYFTCLNNNCDFGRNKNRLPCNVVDEVLYRFPPSLLIATVDKFARFSWDERTSSFFGKNDNRPPELIIQDELHLISSALGSIVGLYEVGIDTALTSRGIHTKYIASTATITNAEKQIRTLFARETAIFPPPGIRYNDSYFAKTIPLEEKPGRLYIGYMAPLLSRQNCLKPLASTLLAAPSIFSGYENEYEYKDAWWTQIVYHGSLKGIGISRTLYQGAIKDYLDTITLKTVNNEIHEEFGPNFIVTMAELRNPNIIINEDIKTIIKKYSPIRNFNVKMLTSKQSAEDNAKVFSALTFHNNEKESIDVALATNMISVGLDVSRLSLMIINGQPLTTAEYIQASSRVGRSDIPGIVYINYYKTQARSLSHYENFRSYHDSFNRFVEPSSLTPFTYQARTRALHAALTIAIRHGNNGLLNNELAGNFNFENELVKKTIKIMKKRCSSAIGPFKETISKTHLHIDSLIQEWENEIEYCNSNRIKLVYHSKDRGFNSLICNFDENKDRSIPWQTLQSMRNVENSALIKLVKGVKL